ncbi:MAG: Gx transporter family protein [Gammaproteobacteria bacterium]|nr:Gx transporter family protein [Gammaproteobacteria bacterium]
MQLRLKASVEDHQIAALAALAIGIHVLEAALPSPLPGIKPGLANVITLVVYALYGLRFAVWVSMLRVFVGSLIIGTFLSPTFVLSFAGVIASLLTLYLSSRFLSQSLSLFGIAVLMALAHMLAQLLMVYWFFIPHVALWGLSPVFMSAALVFGCVTGYVALQVGNRLKNTC